MKRRDRSSRVICRGVGSNVTRPIPFPKGYNLVIAGPGTTAQFPPRDLLIEPAPAPLTKCMDIIRIILAIFLPPVGVFLQVGLRAPFFINILLTLLGYIPGIIHALYVIIKVK